MELAAVSKTERRAHGFDEVGFTVVSDGATPRRGDVLKELCKRLNLDPEHVVITRMEQQFGRSIVMCVAHVYAEAGAMRRREPAHLFARMEKAGSGAADRSAAAHQQDNGK